METDSPICKSKKFDKVKGLTHIQMKVKSLTKRALKIRIKAKHYETINNYSFLV